MDELLKKIKKEQKRVKKKIGYTPNILEPQTLCEKILWNKFFDRSKLLVTTSDKVEVKKYVEEMWGKDIVIPNLFVGEPEDIPFSSLPERYVIKPNHTSGRVIFATEDKVLMGLTGAIEGGRTKINRGDITKTCEKWLKERYGTEKFEWAYQEIERKILIEPMISVPAPANYNFYMFNGKCEFLYVIHGRYTDGYAKVCYDTDWNRTPFQLEKRSFDYPKPKELDKMVRIAEVLSKPFRFVRVDLYRTDRIYFGELTHYPTSGAMNFSDKEWDLKLGGKV